MLKLAAALVMTALMTMLTASTVQQGMRDVTSSMTTWGYFPIRDMRRTVVINPQKSFMRTPPEGSVPTVGVDVEGDLATLAATLRNPVTPDAASIAEGEIQYRRFCTPCHGADFKGDGPVIQFYVPPPDLLAPLTRGRSDGYLYSYIRNGGAVMPAYGSQILPEATWHLVNFLRARQQANPR
jgi:mono/diheme cytochrome c family protein